MDSLAKSLWRKLTVLIGFAAVVAVNWLATTGQINNIGTAAVSAKYPTLFTPQNYTFSIWAAIYVLLTIYVIFQLFSRKLGENSKVSKIAFWFVASCLFNIAWIFAWHYDHIITSVGIMILLLYSLLRILSLVAGLDHNFLHLIGLELPFGLYAGWITVATIANISVLLQSISWNGFGLPAFLWLIIMLLVATLIAVIVSRDSLNVAYPAAVIWGFVGIFTRYLPDFSVDIHKDAMWIVITLGLCLLILLVRWIDIIARRVK